MITSLQLEEAKEELLLIASTKVPQSKGLHASIQMSIPMIRAYFTGTGKFLRHMTPHLADCLPAALLAQG